MWIYDDKIKELHREILRLEGMRTAASDCQPCDQDRDLPETFSEVVLGCPRKLVNS